MLIVVVLDFSDGMDFENHILSNCLLICINGYSFKNKDAIFIFGTQNKLINSSKSIEMRHI